MTRAALSSMVVGLLVAGCSCGEEVPRPPPLDRAGEHDETPLPPATERYRVTWDAPARDAAISEGRAVVERLECTRCHVVDEVAAAARPAHCISCHHWMHGMAPADHAYITIAERYGAATIERYQRNIDHYQIAPDLTAIARRLDPAWIQSWLEAPTDLRPSMDETMVRVRFGEGDVRAIVRYFAAVAEVGDPLGVGPAPVAPATLERPSDARLEEGRALFASRGCNLCHMVGNVDVGRTAAEIRSTGLPARLAPNLRFTRERMHPDVALQWILDPASIHPTTEMPDMNLSRADAETIRDFLWFVDPALEPMPPPAPSVESAAHAALPPVLDRPVGWADVKARVLGRICVHCHMNDHERDRGPGSIGGWGWPAADLRMRTYEMLVAGMACPDDLSSAGEPSEPGTTRRCSVLEPREPGGVPPILEAMTRRRHEELRDFVPAMHDRERPPYPDASILPGMPMGLPHIPDDEVALVRTWIEQGCPGPTEVTGMPGVADGFLVPDGPIEPNTGCGVRAPAATRPEWASHPPPAWASEGH